MGHADDCQEVVFAEDELEGIKGQVWVVDGVRDESSLLLVLGCGFVVLSSLQFHCHYWDREQEDAVGVRGEGQKFFVGSKEIPLGHRVGVQSSHQPSIVIPCVFEVRGLFEEIVSFPKKINLRSSLLMLGSWGSLKFPHEDMFEWFCIDRWDVELGLAVDRSKLWGEHEGWFETFLQIADGLGWLAFYLYFVLWTLFVFFDDILLYFEEDIGLFGSGSIPSPFSFPAFHPLQLPLSLPLLLQPEFHQLSKSDVLVVVHLLISAEIKVQGKEVLLSAGPGLGCEDVWGEALSVGLWWGQFFGVGVVDAGSIFACVAEVVVFMEEGGADLADWEGTGVADEVVLVSYCW